MGAEIKADAGAKAADPKNGAGGKSDKVFDLSSPEWYLNRELTWLEFNRRVFNESTDVRNPLLERVFFLAVIGSNLDEFFMKRIGGLKQQIGAGLKLLSQDGRTPQQQIDESYAMVRDLLDKQEAMERELLAQLAKQKILIVKYRELDEEQRQKMGSYFRDSIYPLLTPQGMDPAHPFPFISNLSLNLLVATRLSDAEHVYLNRIKVPTTGTGIPRFIRVDPSRHTYVLFEDVIANNLETIFPGMVIESCELFRVTRNAITEHLPDQAVDLLSMIETALQDRKFAEVVRLEVDPAMTRQHRGMLAFQLGINSRKDVFTVDGIMGKRDLMEIVGIDKPALHYPPHLPLDHYKLAGDFPNIFHLIREEGPFLLQHPYESFSSSVERFLREASTDPKVLVIKMTLYRTSANSQIIQYLLDAARNGKQVAVVVELMARFDESANIHWATYLEQAGVHVTYGVVGLKTHSKVIFVVRRDYNGLRRYAHIGTGNYHAGTARAYSDLGLLTCAPDICNDLTEFFNFLTLGYSARNYKKLLPAPRKLKKTLVENIKREIEHQGKGNQGLIQLKSNALTDMDVISALYQASQAGVKVELIIRDSCLLRPGIPGLSDNIRVTSIVGRFLEHARIYYFRNNGQEEYYIGSADLMRRNLDHRVEVMAPIESPTLQAQLREILNLQLADRRGAWEMQADGSYVQRRPDAKEEKRSAQELLIEKSEKRLAEARRLYKKQSSKKIAKRKSKNK
ncbi:MAG: polyphosphate kinase 1 [Desulfobulbus sp.]|jgi:polyphosphate kinase|uniref:polyphosphate kinase 1 n=1 Tax=Desulfobulbus sp. TaxID=895 RepID=UPI00283BFC1A|nr:polyphosphate kinase 1 [Desulfobulbus sp.]MDR2550980.1 polyphosphate kinase 1 [Desulfobulbus sp.]